MPRPKMPNIRCVGQGPAEDLHERPQRLNALEDCRRSTPKRDAGKRNDTVVIRKTNHPQIIYAHIMEIALTVMLAFVGIASCAIVMIRMWGPEALAFRKRSRQDTK